MQTTFRLTAHVQTGGRIEVVEPQLPDGAPVEVIVRLASPSTPVRRSVLEVLADAPGHLLFQSAEEVDTYLRAERDAWER